MGDANYDIIFCKINALLKYLLDFYSKIVFDN